MTDNNLLLEYALKYADRGWYVFPCRERNGQPYTYVNKKGKTKTKIPKAKSPYFKGGFLNATRDTMQIIDWWTKHPEACIGISCQPSNLVVVDIDTKDGRKGFDNFMSLNVSTEGALHVLTQSGGMHIIYTGLTNSEANVTVGVDLRSKGAYFIVPPSYIYDENGNKKPYQFIDDITENVIPASVPENLVEKLNLITGKRKSCEKKIYHGKENKNKLFSRAKKALYSLPSIYYDEYFRWVNCGQALKEGLGDDGYELWKEWSSQSDKFDEDECEYKWERFRPRDITIASLFYWAKEESNGQ